MTKGDLISALDPLKDYAHIINTIKLAGPIIEIKVVRKSSDENLFNKKIMTIRCTGSRVVIDVTKIVDSFMDLFIQGIFIEVGIEYKEYNMWHYKRVRGPLTREQKEIFWR